EAKNELQKILAEPLIASLPVAIIANKIDKPTAASEQEIQNYFELIRLRTGRDLRGSKLQVETRPLELFMCSIKEQKGHTDPFKWLSELLN
ncbi:MAG: GTP-binding protein SAR1a, partial [Marteilia pararefringens]